MLRRLEAAAAHCHGALVLIRGGNKNTADEVSIEWDRLSVRDFSPHAKQVRPNLAAAPPLHRSLHALNRPLPPPFQVKFKPLLKFLARECTSMANGLTAAQACTCVFYSAQVSQRGCEAASSQLLTSTAPPTSPSTHALRLPAPACVCPLFTSSLNEVPA